MLARDESAIENEIALRAARERDRRNNAPASATHIADVQDTDLSDTRKYHIGISNIDAQIGSMRPGGMTVLAALTGYGKTVLSEQIAVTNAREYSVMFATLEQRGEQIRDSIIARTMRIGLDEFRMQMAVSTPEYKAARGTLADMNLHLWRPTRRRPKTPRALVEAAQQMRADILIIDYTRRIDGWVPGTQANDVSKFFAEAAEEIGLRIVLLAQLKYEFLKKIGARPTLDDIADSTQLPQEADQVIFLHRPFHSDKRRDNITEVIVPKNRFGKTFRSHVTWYGPLRSYFAMDDEEEARADCCKPKVSKKAAQAQTDAVVKKLQEEQNGSVRHFSPQVEDSELEQPIPF